jgi:hypothetical protein
MKAASTYVLFAMSLAVLLPSPDAAAVGFFGDVFNHGAQLEHLVKPKVAPATQVVAALVVPPPPPAPVQEVVVKTDERTRLIASLKDFYAISSAQADKYANLAMALVVLSILAGTTSGIASFLKKTTLAGIVAFVGTAALAFGNALPISKSADYYNMLSLKSRRLVTLADLDTSMTLSRYDVYRAGFDELLSAAAASVPRRSSEDDGKLDDIFDKLRQTPAMPAR